MKVCSKCKTAKPLESFCLDKTKALGREGQCKECKRMFYLANRESKLARVAAYSKANPEARRSAHLRRRTKQFQNGVFTVRPRDLRRLYSSSCFYCGAQGRMTMDHVVPISRGGTHSIGNLVAACVTCNCSKQDRTITEWRKAA